MRPVVVAGATGFVGTHLVDRLDAAGVPVRRGTRTPREPGQVRLDVDDQDSLDHAFEGARACVYLVHRMGDAHDLAGTEEAAAERVARAAERAGLERVVYLGGPAPQGEASAHLEARLRTGSVLRSGAVPAVELRASMVIGAGSESWTIVRDLALRLPVMILPRWLRNRTQPIAIDDVSAALAHTLDMPLSGSAWYDIPGPETLTAREILERVSAQAGFRPLMVSVPVLTPGLSSHWIRLVTRADYGIARQLVDGLTVDLLAADEGLWKRWPDYERVPFDVAVSRALEDEQLTGAGRWWEQATRRVAIRA